MTENEINSFLGTYASFFKIAANKLPHTRECSKRFKKFFKENPDVTIDEVLNATILYLQNTNSKYVREPHYFIYKSKGSDEISDLLTWIEKRKELLNLNPNNRKLQ